VRFWKNNRLDAEFDMDVADVARMFANSAWAEVLWPTDRKLRAFLTDPAGPISAVFDTDETYAQLVDLVLESQRRPADRSGPRP
jgi:hypothetical protein